MIILKTDREIDYMRDAGKILAGAHEEVAKAIQSGISTLELDKIAEKYIKSQGAIPAFKGYNGFPGSICVSVNQEVVHGIPNKKRKLRNGDNVSIDIGVMVNGYNADAAITHPVGDIDDEMKMLLRITEESLYKGIEKAIAGNRLGDISHAVQTHAENNGFGVVRDYVGHGIGRRIHEDPQIPNYGNAGHGPLLKAGMVLAIEPMLNAGTWEVKTLADGWTVATKDGKPSAHFEHTIVITDGKPEILTLK